MNHNEDSCAKFGDLDNLDTDAERLEDVEIVDGLCDMCRLLGNLALTIYVREHHSSFRNLLRAGKLGCRFCHLISEQPEAKRLLRENAEGIMNRISILFQTPASFLSIYTEEMGMIAFGTAVGEDDPLALKCLLPARSLSTHINPDICASFSHEQMEQCMIHSLCHPVWVGKMPTRVLDVSSSMLILPRLVTTEGLEDSWIALSYCWGSDGSIVTATKANISQLMEGIDIDTFPKTFRDAVLVTQSMGMRYLWIDALCIIQDDPDDLAHELEDMCNIYKRSALTIAIDGASSVSEGFLGKRIPVAKVDIPYHIDELGLEGTLEIRKLLSARREYDVLGSRGWALQETILAPRTLHISKQQLFWSCQSVHNLEGTPGTAQFQPWLDVGEWLKQSFLQPNVDGLCQDIDFKTLRTDFLLRSWYGIVGNYAKRSLSFASDIFPAIAGLAKEVQAQTDLSYQAGLWEQDVHRGLLWCANQNGRKRPRNRAPSWSWASLDLRECSPIYHHVETTWTPEEEANHLVSDIDIALFHFKGISAPFVDTPGEGSFLEVRGFWVTASPKFWLKRDPPFCNQQGRQFDIHTCQSSYIWSDGSFTSQSEGPKEGQIIADFDCATTQLTVDWSGETMRQVSYLLVAHQKGRARFEGEGFTNRFMRQTLWCLMLVQIGGADDEFKRVGIARIPRLDDFEEPEWTRRTIKIF